MALELGIASKASSSEMSSSSYAMLASSELSIYARQLASSIALLARDAAARCVGARWVEFWEKLRVDCLVAGVFLVRDVGAVVFFTGDLARLTLLVVLLVAHFFCPTKRSSPSESSDLS